jgi:hypothetical protein
MNVNKKIKQIGYMPTIIEDEKINLIAEAYHLTRVNVIRNLLYSQLTLDELYHYAKLVKAIRGDDDNKDTGDIIEGDTAII